MTAIYCKKSIGILLLSAVGLLFAACSDDKPEERIPPPYDSMIHEFVKPEGMVHERTAFNFDFLYAEDGKIKGLRMNDFTVQAVGVTINHATRPHDFKAMLEEVGDTKATGNLPAEAWDYRPLTKPVEKIEIYAFREIRPDLHADEEVSRYFDISYVSFYDYIKNGYSWEGLDKKSPFTKSSVAEFNASGSKPLIDANKIIFYISPEVSQHYDQPYKLIYLDFRMKMIFTDGTSLTKRVQVFDMYLVQQLSGYIESYNRTH